MANEKQESQIHGISRGQSVPVWRQYLNALGCVLALPIQYFMTIGIEYPFTVDLLLSIFLTELSQIVNERRRQNVQSCDLKDEDAKLGGKQEMLCRVEEDTAKAPKAPTIGCLAAVVGWREDPGLFTRALESYKTTGCVFLLLGIDGDEAPDQDMVNIFNQTYPDGSTVIHVPEPLGHFAERTRACLVTERQRDHDTIDYSEINSEVMQQCIQKARRILDQHQLTLSSSGSRTGIKQLCIRQPHMHKKGIMFTTFIFSIVIADILGVEFLWSSDSDTIVFPDTISQTVRTMAADPKNGGASSALIVDNHNETAVTKMTAAMYASELFMTRSMTGLTASSDCQSGVSSVFRLAALPTILVPWYLQTIMGKRMIINEDRHLTTNLLLRGWGVVYAQDVLTATDTPTTMRKWLKQQLRWSRATHIESFSRPQVYLRTNPMLFFGMMKKEFIPILGLVSIVCFLLTSRRLVPVSYTDLVLRVVLSVMYYLSRSPIYRSVARREWTHAFWITLGILFNYIPLPAVHLWSLFTLTAGGWGTSMRAQGETVPNLSSGQKPRFEMAFFIIWMGVLAAAGSKWLAASYLGLDLPHTALLMIVSTCCASLWAWQATADE